MHPSTPYTFFSFTVFTCLLNQQPMWRWTWHVCSSNQRGCFLPFVSHISLSAREIKGEERWSKSSLGLVPVTLLCKPGPPILLKSLSFKCKKVCTGAYPCRSAGLISSTLWTLCSGKAFHNVAIILIDEDTDDSDDPSPSNEQPETEKIPQKLSSVLEYHRESKH